MSVAIIVRFQAKEGQAKNLKALLEQARDTSRAAEGCEAMELYQGQDRRNQFVLVQRWSNIAAHRANLDSNLKGSGLLKQIGLLLARQTERAVFNVV